MDFNVNYLILFLIISNLLVPLLCVRKHCIQKGMIEVNHVMLFSVGYILYWILPIAVGATGYLRDLPGMTLWYEIYDGITYSTLAIYLLVCLASYSAFVAGSSFSGKFFKKPLNLNDVFSFDKKLEDLFLTPVLLVSIIFAVLVRNDLFQGYQGSIYDNFGWRGSFTAVSLLLLSLAFIHIAKMEHLHRLPAEFKKLVLNRYFITYFIVATLVLSMGGRLYFLSSFLMLLVYRTVYIRKLNVIAFLVIFVVAAFLAGLIGLYRLGEGVSIGDIVINLLAEFLFTSFSLIHFLNDWILELVKFPVFLISDFINLVPTFVFPTKAAALIQPEEYGYVIFSPGGALNSFFSFMINFGVIGTWVVLFIYGFAINYLRINGRIILFKVMYVMLSGWTAFTFFRDPFSVSIVKTMFEFSILAPMLMVIFMHILTMSLKRERLHV